MAQVAKDSGFTQVWSQIWNNSGQGTGQYQFTSNLKPATVFFWRAYLECGSTLQSPYSTVWSFVTGSGGIILTAPALVEPANGSTISTTPVNLQWSAVSGATQYLILWKKAGSSTTNSWRVTGTQYTPFLDPATTYQWWITAQNDYALGAPSAIWQFTTPSGAVQLPLEQPEHTFVTSDGVITVIEK